jgi:antitoxin ParD1/3/4
MEISLEPELRKFVDEKIKSGEYGSADDVINGALLAMRDRSEGSTEDVEELRRELAIGVEQADRGKFVEFSATDVINDGREQLKRKQKAG